MNGNCLNPKIDKFVNLKYIVFIRIFQNISKVNENILHILDMHFMLNISNIEIHV